MWVQITSNEWLAPFFILPLSVKVTWFCVIRIIKSSFHNCNKHKFCFWHKFKWNTIQQLGLSICLKVKIKELTYVFNNKRRLPFTNNLNAYRLQQPNDKSKVKKQQKFPGFRKQQQQLTIFTQKWKTKKAFSPSLFFTEVRVGVNHLIFIRYTKRNFKLRFWLVVLLNRTQNTKW